MFSYETISPIVSGRKQLKSRSVGYAREKRLPTFHSRQTLEPSDNSQAEAARLHWRVLGHCWMLLIRSIMTSATTLTAVKCTLATNCLVIKYLISLNGVNMIVWLIKLVEKMLR